MSNIQITRDGELMMTLDGYRIEIVTGSEAKALFNNDLATVDALFPLHEAAYVMIFRKDDPAPVLQRRYQPQGEDDDG